MENKSSKNEITSYLNNIKNCLVCSPALKKKILFDLKNSLDEFLLENPTSTIDDIVNHFGTPEDISSSCLINLEEGDISSSIRQSKRIRKIIILLALAIILIFTAACIIQIVHNQDVKAGYFIEKEE